MLAVNIEVNAVRFPIIASPKLDGVRGLVVGGKLLSRKFLPIPNAYTCARFSLPELEGFDGELILGLPVAKDVFNKTSSATSRETWRPDVKFYVFDDFSATGGFSARLEVLKARVAKIGNPHVVLVEQRLVHSKDELLAFEEACLGLGFEGVILRAPNGPYKSGRSTAREGWMLKLKRFTDSEAEILEVIEEMANGNVAMRDALGHTKRSTAKDGLRPKGRAGALRVRDLKTGVVFDIGSGFDEAESHRLWANREMLPGQIVKYKFFAVGVKDKPRFPVYLGRRAPWDM